MNLKLPGREKFAETVNSIVPIKLGLDLCLKTIIIDCLSPDLKNLNPQLIHHEDDFCIINRLKGKNSLYNDLQTRFDDGWNGIYIYIYLSKYDFHIDLEALRCLEDGLITVKNKPSLVWNSQVIVLVTNYPVDHYRIIENDYIRKLSPRSTSLHC